MGNIQSLQRTGTGSTLVDNLSYTYHQGRLQSVHDAVSVPHSEYHLPGTAAYTYDANGNMLSRTNPTHTADNLSAVSYNYLDLPNSITTTTGTTTYTYDAQGRKLQSSQAIGSQNREYIDGTSSEKITIFPCLKDITV